MALGAGRAAAAQQVPTLVEGLFEITQPVGLLLRVDLPGLAALPQPVLLLDELGDAAKDLFVVHDNPDCHIHNGRVSEWIYFIHAPRENFAETMTDEERSVWGVHFERFRRLLAEGVIVLVGPTLGPVNTGIAIFEAPDEAAARKIMEEDPVIAGGYARGELRPFRISLLRGRD